MNKKGKGLFACFLVVTVFCVVRFLLGESVEGSRVPISENFAILQDARGNTVGYEKKFDERFKIELRDGNGDGAIDTWDFYEDRVSRIRWHSRIGHGPPDAVAIYDRTGTVVHEYSWGHFREEEADRIRKQMDLEVEEMEGRKKQGEP